MIEMLKYKTIKEKTNILQKFSNFYFQKKGGLFLDNKNLG